MLLLHRETVEELCKRQVRTTVLKRKQEEVTLTVIRTLLAEYIDVVEPRFCFKVEVFLHSTHLQGVRCFIIKSTPDAFRTGFQEEIIGTKNINQKRE